MKDPQGLQIVQIAQNTLTDQTLSIQHSIDLKFLYCFPQFF